MLPLLRMLWRMPVPDTAALTVSMRVDSPELPGMTSSRPLICRLSGRL